jgi:hypothetical protein
MAGPLQLRQRLAVSKSLKGFNPAARHRRPSRWRSSVIPPQWRNVRGPLSRGRHAFVVPVSASSRRRSRSIQDCRCEGLFSPGIAAVPTIALLWRKGRGVRRTHWRRYLTALAVGPRRAAPKRFSQKEEDPRSAPSRSSTRTASEVN